MWWLLRHTDLRFYQTNKHETYSVYVTHFLITSQVLLDCKKGNKDFCVTKHCLHFLVAKMLDHIFHTSLYLGKQYASYVSKSDGPLACNNFHVFVHILPFLQAWPMETSQASYMHSVFNSFFFFTFSILWGNFHLKSSHSSDFRTIII